MGEFERRFADVCAAADLVEAFEHDGDVPSRVTVALHDGEAAGDVLAAQLSPRGDVVLLVLTSGVRFEVDDDEGVPFEEQSFVLAADTVVGIHDE